MDRHEWTEQDETLRDTWPGHDLRRFAAVPGEVFEMISAEDQRKRSAASAIGSGVDARPAAAREILRLAAENAEQRRRIAVLESGANDALTVALARGIALAAEVERLKADVKAHEEAGPAALRVGRVQGAYDERARIERELTGWLDKGAAPRSRAQRRKRPCASFAAQAPPRHRRRAHDRHLRQD